jgi:hypothetical protein
MRGGISIGAVIVICSLAVLAGTGQTALAQAGSTGGTIGKTDKSISGTDEGESRQSSPGPGRRTATQRVTRSHDAAVNLTGTWSANDGGTYTIRQSGSKVSWESVGTLFSNTFNGVIRDGVIDGKFVDHPPGMMRNSGPLKLRIVDANRMEKIEAGSFSAYGGTIWTRPGR